jgi:RecB family exonuclease
MAVVLRGPARYRAPLEEAFARAQIPAYFARGARRPNPAGRAFLALLACRAEGLSAVRFAEYLSLGQVPDATESGSPPTAGSPTERWAAPEHEFAPEAKRDEVEYRKEGDEETRDVDPESVPVVGGTLRAPRAWEHLLVDAAVIGGRDRWSRRLAGLRAELELDREECEDPEDPVALPLTRELRALDSLRQYALPLLDELDGLPERATWGTWLDGLSALASRSLRYPESVLRALSELAPMAAVGPVELREVQLVLERRLLETITPSEHRSYGHVFVASTDEVRGLQFDVVFVPGLAEKIFPQKLADDPLLPDASRFRTKLRLRTSRDRAAAERLALRLALGAARERVVVSYPRLDLDQSRPRTASFYALEVVRAAEGALLGFDALAIRANRSSDARIGWPAPGNPHDAIDDAEHDLAVLAGAVHGEQADATGAARYLLSENAYLARALRSRWYRWSRAWTAADGLVDAAPRARAALAAHSLASRSFSATALQNYAACPYRFFLQAVHRLAPREEPASVERMDPMQRGSLIHEVQFALLNQLRDQLLLPVTPQNLDSARELLDRTISEVAARYADELYPAIERVWLDSIADVRTDLREWLHRMSEDAQWRPTHFELSFALKQRRAHDPNSTPEPVALSCGIGLRGSIDLVETSDSGTLRATDHKTGKVRAREGVVIDGGKILQPVLYALALERVMPHARVESGRLYYCTHAGEFETVTIPLDESAREGAKLVADTINAAITEGFLPAAPDDGACAYCDYRSVCGPHEELRTSRKRPERLVPLATLRGHR